MTLRRGGVALGDQVIDLLRLAQMDIAHGEAWAALVAAKGSSLNHLLAMGNSPARALRRLLSELFCDDQPEQARSALQHVLVSREEVRMWLPVEIGGFTDFFASAHHAERAGRISRPDSPLPKSFKRFPMGYNGRASAVRISGEPFVRPHGFVAANGGEDFAFARSAALDFELEVGAFVGPGSQGQPLAIDSARDHLFGICLVNDWSARDIQRAESFPLGPFLAKSSMTSISPWIVTGDALAPFRCEINADQGQDEVPAHLRSLRHDREGAFAISLEASISTERMRAAGNETAVLTRTDMRWLHWSFEQMLTHHASGGCPLQPGDLVGSGTVSGPDRSAAACLYELCIDPEHPRTSPIALPNGEERSWLLDGDEIVLRGRAEREGYRAIGFGECRGRVAAAVEYPN